MGEWVSVGALPEFCVKVWSKIQEEKDHSELWDIWLHKEYEKSWVDWREDLDRRVRFMSMTDNDKASIIAGSYSILEDFNPNQGGE